MDSLEKNVAARVAAVLVVATAVSRIIPHPWNFTPLVAMALFSGARLGSQRAWSWTSAASVALPLAALVLGDVALGYFPYQGMAWVYGATAAIALGGRLLRERTSAGSTLGATLVAGALFFVVTNFGVWAAGHLYERTLAGLVTCFVAALPFYGHQIVGDVVFAGALFGLHAMAVRILHGRVRARARAAG